MSTSSEGVSSGAELKIHIACREIFLENSVYTPTETVCITSNHILMQNPTGSEDKIRVRKREVLKVFAHFGDARPVLIFYTRRQPKTVSKTDYYKIILFPISISKEEKAVLYDLFGSIDEITESEAKKTQKNVSSKSINATEDATSSDSDGPSETCPVLIHPEGRGGITIYKEDYMRLADKELLNDIIIDFYLQYLLNNILTQSRREKTHIFSTHFYSTLTQTNTATATEGLSRAQRRHANVQNWTRKINLFEKDFIVIPINKNRHWFVAIICYPGLADVATIRETLAPFLMSFVHLALTVDDSIGVCTGAADASTKRRKRRMRNLGQGMSDDSTNDSNKRPLILIFDSLTKSHVREFNILRQYLTCEYAAKKLGKKVFAAKIMKGHAPKVPQQTNLTDCGVYVLVYVEKFFKETAMDLTIPMAGWTNWFNEQEVKTKREAIAVTIKTLAWVHNPKIEHVLPHISV